MPNVPIELTPAQEKYRARASKRVRALNVESLVTWSDNIGTGMADALHEYLRSSNATESEAALREYVDGAVALQAIALELFAREGLTP